MSSNTQSTGSNLANKAGEVVSGSGQWQSGTTVQEIVGSFSGKDVPQNDPIGKHGGVPNLDFDPKKIKDEVTKKM